MIGFSEREGKGWVNIGDSRFVCDISAHDWPVASGRHVGLGIFDVYALTSLSLRHLAGNAPDFLTLLTRKTPNLNDLQLGTVELATGTWEGLIECMMQSVHLTSFHILQGFPSSERWHRGNTSFLYTKNDADLK